MDVRPSTRAVFEELRAQGNVPSVRKMYAQLKGSYPLLAHELQALREEAAAGLPPLPNALAPVEAERDRVLLVLTPRAADALEKARQTLRENSRLYHDCELFLWKLQRTKQGPLTALLAALVGVENNQR